MSPSSRAKPVDAELELVEGQVAVERRVAPAELVEVHAVHDLDAVARTHLGADSRSPARRSPRARRRPPPARRSAPSPGASQRTKPTGSAPVRFLSRAVAARTSSGSIPSIDTGRPAAARRPATWPRRSSRPERRRAASRPEPDRLTVAQARVAGHGLERVADGVPEVEHLAQARRRARRRPRRAAWPARRRR